MSKSTQAAIISSSSGKAAEIKGFSGVFSCLLEHEVTKTKATFEFTGPKISQEVWAQVMEFFEWTYDREKSEAQVRLFVHPVHGWAAWAFPQEGGTGMTSREEPMDKPECQEQRKQFSDTEGWLYWGTVHHHCSAGAFASSTDDANEKDQEGIHITIGHMDKPVRDFHARIYIKGHKFEPMMNHFWQLDGALLDKADECYTLFGIYPDLNKTARLAMCQNSTALYAGLVPPQTVTPGYVAFPGVWMDNYKVRPRVVYEPHWQGQRHVSAYTPGQTEWCHTCYAWGDHATPQCPKKHLSKKERKALKYKPQPAMLGDGKKDTKPSTLLDDLETQAAVMGFPPQDFHDLLEQISTGNNGALCEIIITSALKDKVKLDDLYVAMLEKEIREEMEDKKAIEDMAGEQKQLGGSLSGWEGYGG